MGEPHAHRTPPDSVLETVEQYALDPEAQSRSSHESGEKYEETESPAATPSPPRPDGKDEPQPNLARICSTRSIPVSVKIVPRSQRSGLLSRVTLLYEAEEPKNYPRKFKWLITFWIAIAATAAPLGSAIVLPALPNIVDTYGCTPFIANLSVALYMLAMSIFPLWWSALSETAGRRTVYIISFVLYVIFNVLSAVSPSIGMFIAMRFLSGGTSAAVQAVGAGSVADVWDVHERGRAMSIFYLGPLCGPLLAPVIGGALTEGLGWRSTQWFQVILGGVILAGIILCLPETHKESKIVEIAEKEATEKTEHDVQRPALARTVSRSSSVVIKTRKMAAIGRHIFIDPLKIILYLRYPAVALTVYYASIAFGALYFLNISVEKTFSESPYNFKPIIVGLLYMFNSAGYFTSSLLGGRWVDHIMHREARKAGRIDSRGKLHFIPEDRVRENAWTGAMIMPVALIWYGWTADKGVFFLAPMIANFFFGIGSMLIFAMATTMLTEFMPKKASNGVALNNCIRNIFSFAGTLLAEPLINAIGNGWLFTILGLIALCSCLVIVAMRRYGDKWREEMDRTMD